LHGWVDERGLTPLITAAEDPMLGLWMISALGELGSAQALPYLEGRIDENITLRQMVTEARWKIGRLSASNPALALAHTLSHDPQKTHRAWAAFRLGELRHTDTVAALLGALSDNDNGVRERAAAALIRIGTPARAAVLTHAAKSGTSQPYAVAVLGYIGELADIVHLQPLAESNSALLSTVAARSTVLIRKFNAVEHTSVLC
jgi:HEAT repeat protein